MATGEEAVEVFAIIRRIGPVIMSAAVKPTGNAGTALRRAVGMLVTDYNMINLPSFAYAFGVCLDLARLCQATLVTMDRVRKAALAENPLSLPAVLTVQTMVRVCLATDARIIAYTEFASRDQVEEISTAVNLAFSEASEVAADDLDANTYQILTRLHGDVVVHLAERARRLPRVISYNHAMVMPALRMAQRAYGNATRYQELINENRVVHPAFMPREGKMLAV